MKKAIFISAIVLIVMAESRGQRQANNNSLITVDVRKSFSPKKELILQDFMDVEYIALETNDDFLNQGLVQDIGEKIILVRNRNQDGDIFVYDRMGKAIRKINRKGQGGEEYEYLSNITLDEDNGEIFVSDIAKRKIFVYDLFGKFKRSFNQKEDSEARPYSDIFNYDKNNLICYDAEKITFVLLSKKDGSITKENKIPYKEKKEILHFIRDEASNGTLVTGPSGSLRKIFPYNGNWIVCEPSSDTVYTFLPDYSLRPFIVRTPSIQSMDPEVFLILRLISDRYYFMESVKKIVSNFGANAEFPKTFFVYDKQENIFLGYIIYNGDFSTKKEIYLSTGRPVNHAIESWQPLEAYQLVESYKKGELKGKLKEIAATLDEEDNPVIMLIKHKK